MKLNGLYTCVNVWCWITRRSTFIPPTSATPHRTNILANKRYLIKIVELVYQSLQNKVHSFIHSIVHGLSALCNFCRTFWWPRFCDFMSLVYVCYWPFHDLILAWNPHNPGPYTNMLWTVNGLYRDCMDSRQEREHGENAFY